MVDRASERHERERRILDAAEDLIISHGYDKMTMADVADCAGVSRGIVYLHFRGKDGLLDALLAREFPLYAQTWLERIEADPWGGTVGGLIRSTLYAINSRPLMAAITKRDKRVFGSYIHKPKNVFASMQAQSITTDLTREMQEAGAIRRDVDAAVIAYLIDTLFLGLVGTAEGPGDQAVPSFDALTEGAGALLDRGLAPDGGGDSEAGKVVIRRLAAAAAREQFEQERRNRRR